MPLTGLSAAMATYRAEPGTKVNSQDQASNAWPEPLEFDEKGLLTVSEDEQDVFGVLEALAANALVPIVRVKDVTRAETSRAKDRS